MLLASCTNPNKAESANHDKEAPINNGQKPAEGGEEPEDNGKRPGDDDKGITIIDIRSERAKEFAKMAERVHAGETVDFLGDGSSYRRWTDANGVEYSQSNGPPNNPSRSTSELWPNGYYKSTHSAYADGIIDNQDERWPGREIQLSDKQRRGFFDERLTLTFIPETGMIHRILEKRDSAEGAWTVIEKGEVPPSGGHPKKKDMNEPANTFPALSKTVKSGMKVSVELGNGQLLWDAGYNVFIQGNGAGDRFGGNAQCDLGDAIKIKEALELVIGNILHCLAGIHPDASRNIQDILLDGAPGRHRVWINCELKDWSPYDAVADSYLDSGWNYCKLGTPCRISFNQNELKQMSLLKLQYTLLHEFLHVSGVRHDPATHDNGNDRIYSCARYCSGCIPGVYGAPQNPNTDCVRCANNVTNKRMCRGYKAELLFAPCMPLVDEECPPNLVCVFHSAEVCGDVFLADCDGSTSFEWLYSVRCGTCSRYYRNGMLAFTECTGVSEATCRSSYLQLYAHDSCNQRPPFCP